MTILFFPGMIERFRRGEHTPSDYEIESQSDDEDMQINQSRDDYEEEEDDEDNNDEDDDDELGKQLERDFLGDSNSYLD